jgi:hypothetical protein
MAGNSSTAAKRSAAAKSAAESPVGTREDPMAKAHPLVGVAGVAEQVAAGPRTAEEQRQAINKEYGEFVALAAITHDGALAYNVGDAVPAANVEAWGYLELGLVARRTTKAAAEAIVDSTPQGDPTDPDAPLD